jgi:hypothetical protein
VGVALAVAAVLAYGFCRHRMPGRGQRET